MAPKTKPTKEEKAIIEVAGKIEDTDEMKLQMLEALDTKSSGDILYPPELNAHLIEQLKVIGLLAVDKLDMFYTQRFRMAKQKLTLPYRDRTSPYGHGTAKV